MRSPQTQARPVWQLGGKINGPLYNHMVRNETIAAYKKQHHRVWMPAICAAISQNVAIQGMMLGDNTRALMLVGPSQLAWNRAPRKIKHNEIKRRIWR
jgi:hypothetical protein